MPLQRFERESPNDLWQTYFKGPIQLLGKKTCPPPDHTRLPEPEYSPSDVVCTASVMGVVRCKGRDFRVGQAFAKERVALCPTTVTHPSEIKRLESLLKELQSARIQPLRNPASVSSKEELRERVYAGLDQIERDETVVHEDVVDYIKKLKGGRDQEQ